MPSIYFEDIEIDCVMPLGSTRVTTEEIKSYARAFDPQPLHLDEEAAKHTMIGRLCASGWHSCAILMRLLCDGFLLEASSLGSPGMEEVKFLKPVFPDEPLSGRWTCLSKRVLKSRSDVGSCRMIFELLNAKGEVALSWDTTQFMKLRTPPSCGGSSGMSNYFEDLVIGHSIDLGTHTFGREEIIDFATKYDPQRFHMSEEGGKDSLFGALCASGWHTSAVWLRHTLDHRARVADRMIFRGERPAKWGPSPGFEKIRWLKPVFVGDTIRYTTKLVEKIDSKSRPGVGLVVSQNQGINQQGELVFEVYGKMFVERRTPFQPASS